MVSLFMSTEHMQLDPYHSLQLQLFSLCMKIYSNQLSLILSQSRPHYLFRKFSRLRVKNGGSVPLANSDHDGLKRLQGQISLEIY